MSNPPPSPSDFFETRCQAFVGYLDYFRSRIVHKVSQLPESQQRTSRLASGWTPVELLRHLTYVELRWLEWGFEGRDVGDPWGDRRDDHWFVDESEPLAALVAAFDERAQRSRHIIEQHELCEIGQPGPRWDGGDPRPWNGSSFICWASTRATLATSTSSVSSSTIRTGSEFLREPSSAS
ncbi:MAG: DUF664 domain-containing protein [Acidimicrobiales bacterium]